MCLLKIAVVDVNRVVSNSSQVMALKKKNRTWKNEELQKWLNTARADVEKQKTQEGERKASKEV